VWAGVWRLKNGVGILFSQAGCLQITGRSGTLTTSDGEIAREMCFLFNPLPACLGISFAVAHQIF
jgi:hypothetical protein